jgi:biopolymer transport protein ExbB
MENSNWLEFAHSAVDYGIIGILVIMSIVSLWLFIERMMAYGLFASVIMRQKRS